EQGAFQEGVLVPACRRGVVREEAHHLGAEARIAFASGVEKGVALAGGQLRSLVEQGPHALAPLWCHGPSSASGREPPASCRASQARARRQSLYTVRSDSPTTRAVSSTVNPV